MKKIKKIIAAASTAVLFTACLASCGGDSGSESGGKTYNLRLGTIVNEDHTLTISAQRYADAVEKATDGNVKITVYASSQLGDYTNVYDELSMGSIDLAWQTIPDTYDKRNNLGTAPYLVSDYEDVRALYGDHESWFFKALSDIHAEKGVTLLGLAPNGFMGVGAESLGNLDTIYDFDTKQDALIRSASIDSLIAQTEAFGFNVTTIAYADLYSALQTGVADGWYGGSAISNYQGFKDVIKYYAEYYAVNEPMGMFMSTKTLESLPEEYQEIMISLAQEENDMVIDDVEKAEGEALQALKDYGIEVITPTDEELADISQGVIDTVYPVIEEDLGADLMKQVNDWLDRK